MTMQWKDTVEGPRGSAMQRDSLDYTQLVGYQ